MQFGFKFVSTLVVLVALLRPGYSQPPLTVPFAYSQSGFVSGGPLVFSLVAIVIVVFLVSALDDDETDEACAALLMDSDVTEAKETALDDCRACTGRSEEACEDNMNCAFSDGTCFLRGDSSVPALFCSFIVSDPDELATCQKCWGLPEAECIEEEPNTDCNFAKDKQICVPDTDDFNQL